MRHFFSLANQNGVLAGTPGGEYDLGLAEVDLKKQSDYIESFFPKLIKSDERVVIVSSMLKRAKETACIVSGILKDLKYEVAVEGSAGLNERYYGSLEGRPVSEWEELYRADLMSPETAHQSAETANELLARLKAFICECEGRFEKDKLLLISHCDPIQALEMLLQGKELKHYSEIKETDYGEIRKVAR